MSPAANITLTSNYTNQGQQNPCFVDDPISVKLGRVIAYCIIILASLISNVLVVAVILKHGSSRKTITYSILNMASTNLVITVIYMPRLIPMFLIGTVWLIDGTLGYILCKIIPFLHGVAILASILNLLATSLDMFFVVVFPMKRFSSTKSAKVGVILTWTLAIIGRLPYLVALRTKVSGGLQICSSSLNNAFGNGYSRAIYYTFLLITFYAIPWVVIFCCYSSIVVILSKGETPGQENATALRLRGARVKAVRCVIRMMVVITFVFLACWITYFSALIAFKLIPCTFRFWRMFLAHSNCAISPVVVAYFNKKIRRGMKSIIWKCKLFLCCIVSSRYVPCFSREVEATFSINDYIDVANFSDIKRRKVVLWNPGGEDLGIRNEGGVGNASIRATLMLSFKALQNIHDPLDKASDNKREINGSHAQVNQTLS